MTQRLTSITIDLDTLRFYAQIHGLSDFPTLSPDPIYTHALPRLLTLFSELSIRATFFVIGEDLQHPIHRTILQDALSQGHEIANHTFRHPYGLTRSAPAEIDAEIALAHDAIQSLLPAQRRVSGFRCPGYNILPPVLSTLTRFGYRYDSSIFPCPPYYLAKAAILALQRLQGRSSRSILGSPRVLRSPLHPYRPSLHDPHSPTSGLSSSPSPSADLWEIPMAVLPYLRLPFIGTFLLLAPSPLLPFLTGLATSSFPLLQVELHGIDLLADTDHPAAKLLRPFQPDLRVSLHEKLQRFRSIFSQILRSHRPLPLEETLPFLPLSL